MVGGPQGDEGEGEHLPTCSVFTWNTSCRSDQVSETSLTDQGVRELYQVSLLSDNVLNSLFCGEMQFGVFSVVGIDSSFMMRHY